MIKNVVKFKEMYYLSWRINPTLMVINIPDQALVSAKISSEELLLDFAVYLYEKQILSIGQARKIVDLDLISFQKELAKRDVFIHFEIEDLEKDLVNLEAL